MTNDQLLGKYARLRQELAQAYEEPVSSTARSGLIDRLASELMDLERHIALLQAPPAATVAEPEAPPDRLVA